MLRKGLLKATFVAGAAATAMTMAMATPSQAQKLVRWKVHSAFGKNLAVIGMPPHRVAKAVKRMSNNKFQLKVFEPNALTGGYAYFDPISKGAIDAGYGTPGAHQGKNSVFAFLSTWPFGPGAPEFVAFMICGGGIKYADAIYAKHNIKYLMCGMIPPETSGWFRKPIKNLAQLKGMKMRFFGVGAKVMQKFGVSTQQLAAADIYPALERGTIDATEFSMPAIDRSLGFYQIAKYNYFPGWHQQSTSSEIIVNMAKWKALPDSYKAMMETACRASVTQMIADGEASQFAAMIANQKDGVKLMTWPDAVIEKFRGAWKEVLAEEIKKNPDVGRFWKIWSSFHNKYKVWGERAYLK